MVLLYLHQIDRLVIRSVGRGDSRLDDLLRSKGAILALGVRVWALRAAVS